jgi:regulator of protease activity HflC (stomatin/prohibitin superfamily)
MTGGWVMNNTDPFGVMLGQPRVKRPKGPLVAKLALGVLVVILFFKIGGWNAGCAALLIVSALGIALAPAAFRRFLILIYLILAVALISGTIIQSRLSTDAVQALVESNSVVRFLVAGEAEQIAASVFLGLLFGLLIVGIPLLAVMWASSEFVLALHGSSVDRRTAVRYLFSLISGLQLPWAIVEDGQVTKTKPEGILPIIGGPGVIVIRPGSAAVFDWGGQVTRIAGPGVVRTKPYERVKRAIDLRPQWIAVEPEKVLTQDRIPLKFTLTVGYQVEPMADSEQRGKVTASIPEAEGLIEGIYPAYKEAVYRAVYKLDPASPSDAVRAVLDAALRNEVGTYNLDGLYDYSAVDSGKERGNAILEIETGLWSRLEPLLREWGLKLLGVNVLTMELPEDIKAKVLEWWVTAWRRETAVADAEAERRVMAEIGKGQAEALEAVEAKKVQLREQLARQLLDIVRGTAGAGVELDSTVAVRLVAVLEAVSTRMTCDSPTALKYLDALEKLMQAEGDKTLIVGESPPLLIRGERPTSG